MVIPIANAIKINLMFLSFIIFIKTITSSINNTIIEAYLVLKANMLKTKPKTKWPFLDLIR